MLAAVDYIIIDEMSMVGRKMFGQVDRRLRQVFPERSEELFGGRSCLLTAWGLGSTPSSHGPPTIHYSV